MAAKHELKERDVENIVPFRSMSMMEEMERMFENMLPSGFMRPFHFGRHSLGETLPHVDVIDRDENIVVRAALPGIKKKDLEVSATSHSLTIRGRSSYEDKYEKGEFYRKEIAYGNFLRTISLPAAVREDKISAVFKEGLLEVTLPKLESAKRHTIDIKGE